MKYPAFAPAAAVLATLAAPWTGAAARFAGALPAAAFAPGAGFPLGGAFCVAWAFGAGAGGATSEALMCTGTPPAKQSELDSSAIDFGQVPASTQVWRSGRTQEASSLTSLAKPKSS